MNYLCDNLSSGRVDFLPSDSRVEFIYCDIENYEKLDKIFPDGIDYVFHLAAQPRVQWTVENPVSSNDINLNSTLRLFTAAKGHVSKIIFSSTSAITLIFFNLPYFLPSTYPK